MSKPLPQPERIKIHRTGVKVAFECGHEDTINFTIIVDGQVMAPPDAQKRMKCADCYIAHLKGDKPNEPKAPIKGTPPGVPPKGNQIGPDAPTPIMPHRTIPKR